MSTEAQFQSAIAATGMTPPDAIHADGCIHRWNGTDKRGNTRNSWYCLHGDGTPAGIFGDWATGLQSNWCAKSDHDQTEAERHAMRDRIKAAQRQRDAERDRLHADAASRALAIWTAAAPAGAHDCLNGNSIEMQNKGEQAGAHDYLRRKSIKPHGTRTDGHSLFVPMRDTAGLLHSLQTIAPDGGKRFMPGGKVKGCYHAIGKPAGSVTVCEGFATGASIHEATGGAVAVAFNAGNLSAVALALRVKYPGLTITIAADDDWHTSGNPGLTAAKQAAVDVGGKLAVPDFTGLVRGAKDTDFNDMARLIREQGAAS